MSSTKRGGQREASDYYVTPIPAIMDFFAKWPELAPLKYLDGPCILDPCAGGDLKHPMSYPTALAQVGFTNVTTLDIRPDSRAEIICDYLEFVPRRYFDLIITNPPFALAQEVATKAFSEVVVGGFVVMLLRLNFFGSKRRKDWWNMHPPMRVFIHSSRMSFTDDGKTDSIEYMHCVWRKPFNKTHLVHLEVI